MTPRRKWLTLLLPLGAAALFLLLKLYLDRIAIFHIPCVLWFLTGLYTKHHGNAERATVAGSPVQSGSTPAGAAGVTVVRRAAACGIRHTEKNHSQKQAFLAAAPGNAHPVLFAAQWDQYASSTPVKLDFGAPEDVLLPPVLPRADWRSSNSPCWYI